MNINRLIIKIFVNKKLINTNKGVCVNNYFAYLYLFEYYNYLYTGLTENK